MKSRSCFEFTGEERFFDGHFPGSPILPGFIQLKLAHEMAEEMCGRPLVLKAVKKMKFMKVIEPHQPVSLELEGDGEIAYRFFKEDGLCSSGVLVY